MKVCYLWERIEEAGDIEYTALRAEKTHRSPFTIIILAKMEKHFQLMPFEYLII